MKFGNLQASSFGVHVLVILFISAFLQWTQIAAFTTSAKNISNNSELEIFPRLPVEPCFHESMSRNVNILNGRNVFLKCGTLNRNYRLVSWVRHRDTNVLTIGTYRYTNDHRFQAFHLNATNEWVLHIQHAQPTDAGIYECQVQISTRPTRSFYVNLHVAVPSVCILSESNFHVRPLGVINLTCIIKHTLEQPSYVLWFHNNEIIDYDHECGRVSVIIDKEETTTSYLLIHNAEVSDSGKYTCKPSNAGGVSVMVNVRDSVKQRVRFLFAVCLVFILALVVLLTGCSKLSGYLFAIQ